MSEFEPSENQNEIEAPEVERKPQPEPKPKKNTKKEEVPLRKTPKSIGRGLSLAGNTRKG